MPTAPRVHRRLDAIRWEIFTESVSNAGIRQLWPTRPNAPMPPNHETLTDQLTRILPFSRMSTILSTMIGGAVRNSSAATWSAFSCSTKAKSAWSERSRRLDVGAGSSQRILVAGGNPRAAVFFQRTRGLGRRCQRHPPRFRRPIQPTQIVAPVFVNGKVVGELDIDSHVPAAFTNDDRQLVEHCASLVGRYLETSS